MAGKDGKDGGDDGDFTLAVLQAFQQDCVVQQLQKIFKSSIAPPEDALRQMNETNAALWRQIADRDETIRKLEERITELELKSDGNEQQGRKGSIRIFGLPEQGQGTLEQKLMRLLRGSWEGADEDLERALLQVVAGLTLSSCNYLYLFWF